MAKASFEVVGSGAYLPYLLPPWLVLSVNQDAADRDLVG